uniref:Uncharacterized protein n=1 Tax=Haplochromis burtoni TaxID=8153 RepID=A0A3Q2WBD2_HAPBU
GGQHTLLHGETLLVVSSADAHYIALQKVSRHLSGHSLLIEGTFWQPVLKDYVTFILPNRPSDGPPRKRDRISASWSHIDLKCYRDNWFAEKFRVIKMSYY